MSATMDGARVRNFWRCAGVARRPRLSGRVALSGRDQRPTSRQMADAIVRAMRAGDPGSILAFLPGAARDPPGTQTLARRPARSQRRRRYRFTARSTGASRTAPLRPPRPDRRKIVLATSIAETSITIQGVRTVVDAGSRVAALRARCRRDAARDPAGLARRSRSAPRTCRPDMSPAFAIGCGRSRRQLRLTLFPDPKFAPPIFPLSYSIWRRGARAPTNSRSSIRRRARRSLMR